MREMANFKILMLMGYMVLQRTLLVATIPSSIWVEFTFSSSQSSEKGKVYLASN